LHYICTTVDAIQAVSWLSQLVTGPSPQDWWDRFIHHRPLHVGFV